MVWHAWVNIRKIWNRLPETRHLPIYIIATLAEVFIYTLCELQSSQVSHIILKQNPAF
jgi:hypothetical protein